MKLKLKFKNFESQLARRAGVINDNSFFEIQMQTQSRQGRFLYQSLVLTNFRRISIDSRKK